MVARRRRCRGRAVVVVYARKRASVPGRACVTDADHPCRANYSGYSGGGNDERGHGRDIARSGRNNQPGANDGGITRVGSIDKKSGAICADDQSAKPVGSCRPIQSVHDLLGRNDDIADAGASDLLEQSPAGVSILEYRWGRVFESGM